MDQACCPEYFSSGPKQDGTPRKSYGCLKGHLAWEYGPRKELGHGTWITTSMCHHRGMQFIIELTLDETFWDSSTNWNKTHLVSEKPKYFVLIANAKMKYFTISKSFFLNVSFHKSFWYFNSLSWFGSQTNGWNIRMSCRKDISISLSSIQDCACRFIWN